MKLSKVQIREFRSVWKSNEFEVGDVTCLVGKNEAGKTAILKALYRLNPVVNTDAAFDATDDYPRAYVKDYTRQLKSGGQPSTIVAAAFSLEPAEREELEKDFGKGAVTAAPEVSVWRGYDNKLSSNVHVNEQATVIHLVTNAGLPQEIADEALKTTTLQELGSLIEARSRDMTAAVAAAQAKVNEIENTEEKTAALEAANQLGEPQVLRKLRENLAPLVKEGLATHIWNRRLANRMPRFLYFDEYYQMDGQVKYRCSKGTPGAEQSKSVRPSHARPDCAGGPRD